jgi:hypothetical protein
MAKDKKSFILYADILKSIEHFTNEEKGILFTHLLEYVNDKNPVLEDRLILTAWKPIELQLKRDLVKYEEVREKRSIAGKNSAKIRNVNTSEQNLTNPTSVESVQQNTTNPTDNVNDNVNDNVINKKINKNKITIWLDKNCPTVQKMKEPITYEQAEKLLNDFPTDKEKAILADTFLAMENHSQLLKKYKSANLTVRNWVKNRFDSEPKTQLGKADKWTHPDQVDITDLDFFSKWGRGPPIEDAEAQHQWSCIWKVQQHRQYISDNNL